MTPAKQRGILLLPVALTLAIAGALAYTMTHSASMEIAAFDAQHDTDTARYLAEAGVQLAKWQNERILCGSQLGFGTVTLPGGQIVSNNVKEGSGKIKVSLTATTTRGAVNVLVEREVRMHRTIPVSLSIKLSDMKDTYIQVGSPQQGNSLYLEMTDANAHGLMSFSFPGALDDAAVLSAELSLVQTDSKSTMPNRSLALHRVLRDWSETGATWTSPWSTPGGDYVATPAATVAIDGNARYAWRIDALVEGWANKTLPNNGLLLKPSGLLEARFHTRGSPTNQPKLDIRYLPRC
ncbi:DNRLRE domain-containing protein [Massilia sp. H6]|uniref:DNRLRE domain-containing protein n=1 Tax=Massilia sp. H6 TaxID=2970464 RepID=UPI002167B90E|nr:DNRLRE domain-containing protein [Massilia sp. H6]UVW28731.1 DNRLRE domain-containing protein [Massilia sp. H6]